MASIEEEQHHSLVGKENSQSVNKAEETLNQVSQRISPPASISNSRVLKQPEVVPPPSDVSGIIGENHHQVSTYNVERTRQAST